MSQPTVNPYEEIGDYISTGLASIIASLPATPTIDDLVDQVYAYVGPLFYGVSPSLQVQLEMKQVARTAINSYVNNLVMGGKAGYTGNQLGYISILIGNQFTSNLPIISIANRIEDVEDNLTDNQLSVPEQTPILLATSIGSKAYTYWSTDVQAVTPVWAAFYPPTPEKYMDLPYYVEAAMVGALAGYGATPAGMIEPSVNFVTNKQISALIGALTVTAGKVIFQWIPRIQHMISLNPQTIANLGGGGRIGAAISGGSGCVQHCILQQTVANCPQLTPNTCNNIMCGQGGTNSCNQSCANICVTFPCISAFEGAGNCGSLQCSNVAVICYGG